MKSFNDVSSEQSVTIGLAVICLVMLYAKNNKLDISAAFALFLVTALSFAFPLIAIVMIVPITLIIYIDSYKSLSTWWTEIQKIKIVKN